MKNCFLVFLLFTITSIYSQRNEIGIMVGTANLISDVGSNNYIQSPFVDDGNGGTELQYFVSGIYKRNINSRFGLRGQLSYGKVTGFDAASDDPFRQQIGASYNNNNILEGAALFEYNFFDFNHNTKTAFTPYVFSGLAFFSHKNRTYEFDTPNQAKIKSKYNSGISFPFGAGIKLKTNFHWVLTIETGFRSTSQDDIDYSNPDPDDIMINDGAGISQEDASDLLTNGQTENNDWYTFTGISLTYAFGSRKCYRTDTYRYRDKKSTIKKYRRKSSRAITRDQKMYEKSQEELIKMNKKDEKALKKLDLDEKEVEQEPYRAIEP